MEERTADAPVFQILKENVAVVSAVSPVLHNLNARVFFSKDSGASASNFSETNTARNKLHCMIKF